MRTKRSGVSRVLGTVLDLHGKPSQYSSSCYSTWFCALRQGKFLGNQYLISKTERYLKIM